MALSLKNSETERLARESLDRQGISHRGNCRSSERTLATTEATAPRANCDREAGGHIEVACVAWRKYGKGRHPAGLNFGDCFAYALAKVRGEPILFKGDDFTHTDLSPVLT